MHEIQVKNRYSLGNKRGDMVKSLVIASSVIPLTFKSRFCSRKFFLIKIYLVFWICSEKNIQQNEILIIISKAYIATEQEHAT